MVTDPNYENGLSSSSEPQPALECPTIISLLQQLAVSLATKTQTKICEEISGLEAALGGRVDEVEVAIASLSNIEGFAQKLAQLTELIDTLDTNEDGHFEELTGITNQLVSFANQITALVSANTAVNDLAASTERNLINLEAALNAFKVAVENTLTPLLARFESVEGRITALESRPVADFCALGREIQAGLAQISDAIDAVYAVSCRS